MGNVSNWKGLERKVATLLGTYRTPMSGSNSRHTASDTLHKELFVECKKRKKFAIITLFEETLELAKRENKVPVVVIQETGSRKRYYVIEEQDLIELAKCVQLEDQDGK